MTPAATPLHDEIDESAGPRHHIVLSPHYDDMALSIGATVAAFSDAGRQVTDLIVFGAEPAGVRLHPFAQHHHDSWGLTAVEVVIARKAEEGRAVQILGASTANLSFFDAIYRSDYYTSDAKLFGAVSPQEGDLPDRIADEAIAQANALAAPDKTAHQGAVRFYAPLAIGNHVDHQIAFLAAARLDEMGYAVWLYEDLPYAMIGDNRDRRLTSLAASGPNVLPVAAIPADPGWSRKIEAILAYPSQLETVFRNYAGVEPTPQAISTSLGDYHRVAGDGRRVERFWRFSPT